FTPARPAVIVTGRRAERAAEAERQRAGDHAEALGPLPACVVLLPARSAGAEAPAAERMRAESSSGVAAPHRRAEKHDIAARDFRMMREHVVDQHAAEA